MTLLENLTNKISNLFQRLRPPRETTTRALAGATTYERAGADATSRLIDQLDGARSRRQIIEACRAMYEEDPRPKAIIDRVADSAVRRGFTVSVAAIESAPTNTRQVEAAQEIIAALVERTTIQRQAHKYLRRAFRDGDLFLQVVIDGDSQIAAPQIAGLHPMPTLQMFRNSNDVDEFDDPAFAFWQSGRVTAYSDAFPPPMHERAGVTWFTDWQIVHARYDHDAGSRYGRPLLAPARRAYNRLRDGEKDMAIRRRTRAPMRYNHEIGTNDDGAVKAYRKNNQVALNNPLSPVQDFIGTAKVTPIQGDAHLNDIADVLHHLDAFSVVSPIPLALIGYGRDINRDILRDQYAQYLLALDEIAEWFEHQVLLPIFELELLLNGIFPDDLAITVQWAEKREAPFTVEEWLKLASSRKLTDETLLKLLQKALPDFDAEAEIEAWEAAREQEEQDMMGRLPDGIDALVKQLSGGGDDDEPAEENQHNGHGVVTW
jgi:hypothetical protein